MSVKFPKHNARSLVIGANGFVARHLINYLAKDSNVIGIYNQNSDSLVISENVKYFSYTELSNLELEVDIVYILSAYIPNKGGEVDLQTLFNVNIQLVRNICNLFSHCKIVYSSSVSVYSVKLGAITENDSLGGLNEYGLSKLWAEHIIMDQPHYSIVRCSSIYGPGMKKTSILPSYIIQGLNGRITVLGDGKRMQNYIYIDDLVKILVLASKTANCTLLGVSNRSISNIELAKAIQLQTGGYINFEGCDKSPSFIYNREITENLIKLESDTSIDIGLKNTIKWIKKEF